MLRAGCWGLDESSRLATLPSSLRRDIIPSSLPGICVFCDSFLHVYSLFSSSVCAAFCPRL